METSESEKIIPTDKAAINQWVQTYSKENWNTFLFQNRDHPTVAQGQETLGPEIVESKLVTSHRYMGGQNQYLLLAFLNKKREKVPLAIPFETLDDGPMKEGIIASENQGESLAYIAKTTSRARGQKISYRFGYIPKALSQQNADIANQADAGMDLIPGTAKKRPVSSRSHTLPEFDSDEERTHDGDLTFSLKRSHTHAVSDDEMRSPRKARKRVDKGNGRKDEVAMVDSATQTNISAGDPATKRALDKIRYASPEEYEPLIIIDDSSGSDRKQRSPQKEDEGTFKPKPISLRRYMELQEGNTQSSGR
jgi:hypothetical protein